LSQDEIVTAVRRSERALVEQLSEWESLEFGVAHVSSKYPTLARANQLREVWLADLNGEAVFAKAEAYYSQRDLVCRAWVPASGQPIEPIDRMLDVRSWTRVQKVAMGLVNWRGMTSAANEAIRILPARAMPKAHRQTYADAGDNRGLMAQVGADRLNDSNHDIFVATINNVAAGRIGYLQVGDIARMHDLYVAPPFRGRGIGHALMSHFMQLARRLLPKSIVAAVPQQDVGAIAFVEACGFATSGMLTEYHRPA
jgi:ribosomal protein S18 acetylase RimI-like enzyme